MSKKIKSLIICLIALILVISSITYFFWESTTSVGAASATFKEAVLKPDTSGNWYILANSTHSYVGSPQSITQNDTSVTWCYPAMDYVSGSSFEENYILLDNNIMAGASVGLSCSVIYFYQDGELVNQNIMTSGALFVRASGVNN